MWVPCLACPTCRSALTLNPDVALCVACGARFTREDRLFRLLSCDAASAVSPFLEQFRAVRRADGHGDQTLESYRALPHVPPESPLAEEWRIRRESYETISRRLASRAASLRILDIGAGNGWLCSRLARAGHRPVAVDLNDDPGDGLLASRHAADRFPLVQAHFDALPFEAGQFDLVIMNASLHYAPDPARTLREADRQVASGGVLVVMDSPMFRRPSHGEAMAAQQLARLRHQYGIADPVRPGPGFLTFAQLQQAAATIGRRGRFVPSRGPLTWRIRRQLARVRMGRPAAAFGVWATQ